jgi:hypothetical protein
MFKFSSYSKKLKYFKKGDHVVVVKKGISMINACFFWTGVPFFLKKMYKTGILCVSISLALYIKSTLVRNKIIYATSEIGNNKMVLQDFFQNDFNWSTMFFISGFTIFLSLFFGLFGNKLYIYSLKRNGYKEYKVM